MEAYIELLNKHNRTLGNIGEKIAYMYLKILGFEIIKCNFRCKYGEIDLIAKKNKTIHFVEVKTRTNKYIEARNAINKSKQEHIWKTSEYYLYKNNISDVSIEYDAVEIYLENRHLEVNYIPQIIEK